MKSKRIISILALAQFVMVLDSTVMNVSISEVSADLGTNIEGLQAAITFYALTMAALMLLGGKLGGRWGTLRAFRIGSVVYGIGSLITAFSQNLPQLFIGWSIIEGLGAILVIPAIAALIASNYHGKERAVGYALIGGIAGAAAAAGPLIGGFFTTYLSWRYVFAGETLIMLGVLYFSMKIPSASKGSGERIDMRSVAYSAIGMAAMVFGMLQSKTWGWVRPLAEPTINGQGIAPFGISVVAYLILGGVLLLWAFYRRQGSLIKKGIIPYLDIRMLKIPQLKSGLLVLMSQYIVIASIFFVVPVYLQTVLGLDALQTGIKIVPLSIAVIAFSIFGSRWSKRFSPRQLVRLGQGILVIGSFIILASISPELESPLFAAGMFILGAGIGLISSQLGNVNMSAVAPEQSNEAGGLQGTSQNLGSSFGTAVVGSIVVLSLTSIFASSVASSDLPADVKQAVQQKSTTGITIVSHDQAETIAEQAGLSQATTNELIGIYEDSQIEALRIGVFGVAVIGLISLMFSGNIPNKSLAEAVPVKPQKRAAAA